MQSVSSRASSARLGADHAPAPDRMWLLFRAGRRHIALPASSVIETLRVLQVLPCAGAPRFVTGLCVIRGTPLAIVDVALLLGDPPARHERTITVRVGNHAIGLAADEIVGVRAIASGSSAALPSLVGSIDSVEAIATIDEHLVFLLRAARILSDEFLAGLADRRADQ